MLREQIHRVQNSVKMAQDAPGVPLTAHIMLRYFPDLEIGRSVPRINGETMSTTGGTGKTNGMAIAGFVLAFLCWPLGIVFSGIGMSQTSKDPSQGGRGLAVAGLVISILSAVITMVFWGSIAAMMDSSSY